VPARGCARARVLRLDDVETEIPPRPDSAKYATLAVADDSAPVSLTHDGYTSVYTVDKSNGDLQETYLTAIGQPWATQDLSAKYGTARSSPPGCRSSPP
jgi:hypothetical protein